MTTPDPATIDAVAAEHLLHLEFTERFGMDWRLECLHAPDDERWFPTPADGLNDYDADCCWTISWFKEDGIECVVTEWPEPISFPALVHCWWDNEALRIEPATPSGGASAGWLRTAEDRAGGAALIAAERQRQINGELWTAEGDDEYVDHQLARAAICYVQNTIARTWDGRSSPPGWPWGHAWWKPSSNDPIRDLVKAGALIAAEIDRARRVAAGGTETTP